MTDGVDAQFEFLLRLGDNALILGHRVSEWCGRGPVLEEDIALANIALDLIGQTQLWLELAAEVEGKGRTADDLAYGRDAMDFRNLLLLEQPNGDFGFTLMRQFLFDAWHLPLLRALERSSDKRVADIAQKIAKEVTYHLERSTDLVVRLGDGTEESHARLQRALDALFPFVDEMLECDELDQAMIAAGVAPSMDSLPELWQSHVATSLSTATLTMPESGHGRFKGRGKRGVHTEHLGSLLAEMQFLPRAYPDATW